MFTFQARVYKFGSLLGVCRSGEKAKFKISVSKTMTAKPINTVTMGFKHHCSKLTFHDHFFGLYRHNCTIGTIIEYRADILHFSSLIYTPN